MLKRNILLSFLVSMYVFSQAQEEGYALQLDSLSEIKDSSLNINLDFDYNNPKLYEIGGVTVNGIKNLNKSAIVKLSGLIVGDRIKIPGDNISSAISKLWEQGLFEDIKINAEKISGDIIFLNIELKENPRLSKFKFKGKISKSDITSLKEKMSLIRGKVLTQDLINNSLNTIKEYYINKGFFNVQVNYTTTIDSTISNAKNLIFNINKGKKVKIKEIIIQGRQKIANTNKTFFNKKDTTFAISDKAIRKSMKETKKKSFWNIFKTSKFIDENYENDKANLINTYNEAGYRDARILRDSIYLNREDNTLTVQIEIFEGDPYKFGKITFVGNTVYNNNQLYKQLGIKENELFNQSRLESRLFGSPDGNDLSSLYLDNGYLFFNATPIEISINEKKIDLEIKIYEGKQARVNKVAIKGNTKTNDHVIMREIRTKPGDLFKRSDIMRSQRELAQMQYFDPEAFDVKIEPDPVRNEVDITYVLSEKSSDQIQLQGGWGGGRVVGSLGFTFNNFSTRNFFKKDKWNPLPSGDGQRFTIAAQSNGVYYQQYRMSFVEPWLGGKKPNSLSFSLYKSISSNGQEGDERQAVELTGLTIGLSKRLKKPDDYFRIYNGINFQRYDLYNSQSFFSFTNGYSNNANYNIQIDRNSVDQLIYPRSGSNFLLSLKFTPPYSMLDEVDDYSSLTDQEKYKWIEYYKWNFKYSWFSSFTDKLVLATRSEIGFLGAYNNDLGVAPFERFYVGGDALTGMGSVFDGRELIALRGYSNNSISPQTGGTIYNKYTAELRYAISLNPGSTVYVLGFAEAGNSWENQDNFNPFQVKRSAGIGFRISLPMLGLMGLDYGWGLDEIPGNPDANGGQFHFSINQQF